MPNDKNGISTIVEKTIRSLKRNHPEGGNRRRTNYWPYIVPLIPLAIIFVSGAMGYSRLQGSVDHNAASIKRIENMFIQWNKSISERVQYLERK